MKTYNFKKLTLNITDSWEHLSLDQYQRIFTVLQQKDDTDLTNIKIIEILSGNSEEQINQLLIEEYKEVCQDVVNLLSNTPEFPIQKTFDINGITYQCQELNELSLGEMRALQGYSNGNGYEHLHGHSAKREH
jgi:hypothetical protein